MKSMAYCRLGCVPSGSAKGIMASSMGAFTTTSEPSSPTHSGRPKGRLACTGTTNQHSRVPTATPRHTVCLHLDKSAPPVTKPSPMVDSQGSLLPATIQDMPDRQPDILPPYGASP